MDEKIDNVCRLLDKVSTLLKRLADILEDASPSSLERRELPPLGRYDGTN